MKIVGAWLTLDFRWAMDNFRVSIGYQILLASCISSKPTGSAYSLWRETPPHVFSGNVFPWAKRLDFKKLSLKIKISQCFHKSSAQAHQFLIPNILLTLTKCQVPGEMQRKRRPWRTVQSLPAWSFDCSMTLNLTLCFLANPKFSMCGSL